MIAKGNYGCNARHDGDGQNHGSICILYGYQSTICEKGYTVVRYVSTVRTYKATLPFTSLFRRNIKYKKY